MFSKSVFPFLGIIIGAAVGGFAGAIAGLFLAAILHGLLRGLMMRSARRRSESQLDELVNMANSNPEVAAKIHQLAALKRMEQIVNLYNSGNSMPTLSIEEQQAYIVMLEFMRNNSSTGEDKQQFEDFLHKVNMVHFKGNSMLSSHLRQCS